MAWSLLSSFTTMSVFVTSTVSMFGIALAVDYSCHPDALPRGIARGRQPHEAVDAAMASPGSRVLSGYGHRLAHRTYLITRRR